MRARGASAVAVLLGRGVTPSLLCASLLSTSLLCTSLLGATACATLDDRPGIRWEDVEDGQDGDPPAGPRILATSAPAAAPAAPSPPASPPAPAAPPAAGPGPIDVDGRPVEDGALLEMPGLELACLPAADALTAPLAARARYDETAGRLGLPVGRLAFVVLTRDPARSLTDPPPHLCRAIPTAAALKAPFLRTHEPARRWLFRRIGTGLVEDAAALVAASAARQLVAGARPRVLVDDRGGLVAVALPVDGPGQDDGTGGTDETGGTGGTGTPDDTTKGGT